MIEAELVLSQPQHKEKPKPKQSSSPLSETKMADLPGMAPNAGADSSTQTLQPGSVLLDRYEIKAHIAQGGMGAVYRAFDKNRGSDIAIKVMLPQLMQNETARERFLDEARLSSQLSHPNIVNVYDVQQQGDLCFLTMELLEGQDLRELMENRKLARQNFSVEEVLEILTPICAALDHAHELTVHRDIKPENIFLTEEGKYKLMDFGIARVMSTSQRTQTGAASGTAYYMAPEQLKGAKDIDGRADQYALAVLTYELLSGEVPAGAIEPLHELVKGINKKISAAVQKALSPKPENRFDSLSEFLSGLQGSGKGAAMPALPVKMMGMVAGVIGAVILLVVLVSSGALNNLDSLLPESAEVVAAKKAKVAKLQGEINTYKQRLDNGRRQLSSDLRDASRNKSSDEKNLENWQTLTDNYIFNGSQITDLEGDLSMGESLLRDDGFEQAEVILTKVRDGYKNLWEQFNAAEELFVAKQSMEKAESRWEKRKKSYGFTDPAQVKIAKQNESKAESKQRQGDFGESLVLIKIAKLNWDEVYKSVMSDVETIDKRRKEDKRIANKKAADKAATQRKLARIKKREKLLKKALPEMVTISSGSYRMGTDAKFEFTSRPVHSVNVKRFKLSKTEATIGQWQACVEDGACSRVDYSHGIDESEYPVTFKFRDKDQINNKYIPWLNKISGRKFRLPTESEWEFAARAGTTAEFYWGNKPDCRKARAYFRNACDRLKDTVVVASFSPNKNGLYDMIGNVSEIVKDCWNPSFKGAPVDGSAWLTGNCSARVIKGGSYSSAFLFSISNRSDFIDGINYGPSVGFRLAEDY